MSRDWTCRVNSHKPSANKALNNTVFSIGKLLDNMRYGTYEDKFAPPPVDKWEMHESSNVTFKRYPVSDEEIQAISPEAWKLANEVGVKMKVYRAEQFSDPKYNSASGFYNKDEQTLYLVNEKGGNYKYPGGLKDTLNHELVHQIQHAIAGYEGKPHGQFLTNEDYRNADKDLREVMKHVLVTDPHYSKLEPRVRKAEIEAFWLSVDLSRFDPFKDRARRLIKLNKPKN